MIWGFCLLSKKSPMNEAVKSLYERRLWERVCSDFCRLASGVSPAYAEKNQQEENP